MLSSIMNKLEATFVTSSGRRIIRVDQEEEEDEERNGIEGSDWWTSHLRHAPSGTDSTTTRSLRNNARMTHTNHHPHLLAILNQLTTTPHTHQDSIEMFEELPIFDNGTLSSLDHDVLEKQLAPVAQALKEMDAEYMLNLQRREEAKGGGAQLCNGICIQPIHDEILPKRQGCVRYLHLSEVPNKYSIGIFVFPPYATIPLHDHPGMCVLSRILYGDLHRLSLDIVMDTGNNKNNKTLLQQYPKGTKRAKRNGVDYLQAPNVTCLYPLEGNLHEFVAGPNGAAVLDVLLPPYGDRDCTFYAINDNHAHDGKDCVCIPTGQPEDFHCISGTYGTIGEE